MIRSLLAIFILRLVSLFPLPVVHAIGHFLGNLFYRFNNELRKVAHKNIELCFSGTDKLQQDLLVRETLNHVGMAMMESGALWLWSQNRVLKLVSKVTGEEILKTAMAKGNGVILLMPHLGSWEMTALYGSHLYPMTSLYRPLRLKELSRFVRGGREKMGATLVPTDASGVKALRKAISNGEVVGILPDQDPGKGAGIFVPFFGIQANTSTLLSRLAYKTGAEVVVSYAERLPKGQGFHVHFVPSPECIASSDTREASVCLNQVIEECTRKLPGQYQWAYKRFKTRPQGESRVY